MDSRERNRGQRVLEYFILSGVLPLGDRQTEEDGGRERIWNEEPDMPWFAYHLAICRVGLRGWDSAPPTAHQCWVALVTWTWGCWVLPALPSQLLNFLEFCEPAVKHSHHIWLAKKTVLVFSIK